MNETTKKVLSVAVAGTVMAGVPVTAYAADNNAQEATVIEETATQNYIVKEGDTLGKIAELFYGNPDYYLALANYNHIKNPALIFPGQIITIPQTLSLQGGLYYDYNCNEIIITGVQEPVQQEAQAVQIYDGSEDQYYTVKDGDTMYCIVSKFYQSKKQEDVDKLTTYNWYFNDKFTDPNKIYRGQVLRIPPYAELQKVQQQDYTQQYNQPPPYPQAQNKNFNQQQIPPQPEDTYIPQKTSNNQQKQPQYNPNNNQENPKRHKPNYSINPNFVELAKGKGIDQNEYNTIISAAKKAYEESKNDRQTLSFKAGREIKNTLNGQWFVFVSEKGKKFDFSLSTVASNDYLTFSIGNSMFQVCRLRE